MPKKGRSPHGHSLIETSRAAKADWCSRCNKWFQPLKDGDDIASGKFLLRVPPRLHKRLVEIARSENVSLSLLVNTMLAEHVGKMKERAMWIAEVNKSMGKK